MRSAFKMTYRPLLDRASLKGKSAIDQMADDMRVFSASAGAITVDDLNVIGWPRTSIDAFAARARELAYRRAAP